jgi:hypothetical protein
MSRLQECESDERDEAATEIQNALKDTGKLFSAKGSHRVQRPSPELTLVAIMKRARDLAMMANFEV